MDDRTDMMNDNDTTPPAGASSALAGWDAVAILVWVIIAELALLQAFAVGAATGIYHLAPLLEVGQPADFDHWLDIFQVVGPMLTLPGGAAIVLSTWLLTRRAQRAERRAAAEKERADAAEANAATANANAASLQAEVERLRTQNGR